MKTDNANLPSKLALRRHFLSAWPPESVLDCCQGNGIIWSTLRREYPVRYMGVDIKHKKGRVKIDSVRILDQPGWDFDVVDIDTYGSPFKHWLAVLLHGRRDITVFLTIGRMGGMTVLDKALLSCVRLNFTRRPPNMLISKFHEQLTDYAIAAAGAHGWAIIEAMESPRSRNARYIGIRLKRLIDS
ncbi:MAG: hypothetical protein WCQ69_08995 [Bacteroidales bacterium]|jgi:hypothetical protein